MSSSRKVSKVVIPVAGLGSRFLPATKALPKELLPIVNKPIIHHIVKEAVDAGIETVVFVTSRPKILIEDYFDPADLTSHKLAEVNKSHLIDETLELTKKIDIVSVRQYHPLGLGHAVMQAAPIVGGQSFAVVLGDDLIRTKKQDSAIAQCLKGFAAQERGSLVGVLRVPKDQTSLYGICDLDGAEFSRDTRTLEVKSFVEKPSPEEAPSQWALPGRYVFEPAIIDELRTTRPGKGGEIQLTDAMASLLKKSPFFAQAMEGERFDTGNQLGYIVANVAYGLDDPSHRAELSAYLKELMQNEGLI
jgi:UTP--glucose-1-phosphate uridylyltransferase